MNVVNLGDTRNLLERWDVVRQRMLRGQVKGFAICIKDWEGAEAIYLAGDYKDDPKGALKAAMAMSWEITKVGDSS